MDLNNFTSPIGNDVLPGISGQLDNISVSSGFMQRNANARHLFNSTTSVGTANSGTVATITYATSPYGTTRCKVDMPAGNTWTEIQYHLLNEPAFDGVVLWRVWVEDPTKVDKFSIYCGSDTSYTRLFQFTHNVNSSNTDIYTGDTPLVASQLKCNASPTFLFGTDSLKASKIRIFPTAGQPAIVWVEGLYIAKPLPRPVICLTFDDASKSWMTLLRPLLQKYNLKATFAVNWGEVGTNDALYVNSSDILSLYNEGHDIASHNVSNLKYITDQTLAQYMTDFITCRNNLSALGCNRGLNYHPYVQGGYDSALITALQGEGVDIARGVYLNHNQVSGGYFSKWMALDERELSAAYTLATRLQDVSNCLTYGTTTLFMGHDLVRDSATPTGVQWKVSDYDKFLAKVAAARDSGALVLTMSQLSRYRQSAGL